MTNDDKRLLIVTAKAVASILTGVSDHGDQGKLRQEIIDLLAKPEAVQMPDLPGGDTMKMAELIQWGCEQNNQFFLRCKSNGEWEAGWGNAAGEMTVRADTAISTLRELHRKYATAHC